MIKTWSYPLTSPHHVLSQIIDRPRLTVPQLFIVVSNNSCLIHSCRSNVHMYACTCIMYVCCMMYVKCMFVCMVYGGRPSFFSGDTCMLIQRGSLRSISGSEIVCDAMVKYQYIHIEHIIRNTLGTEKEERQDHSQLVGKQKQSNGEPCVHLT